MTVELEQTWDDDRLRRERLGLVQAQMRRLGIGAMYIGENASVRYLLNLKIPSSSAFVPAEGEVIAFMRPRDEGYVKLHYANIRPPLYDPASAWGPGTAEEGGTDLLVRSLTALMEEHGVAGEPLGVEKLDLPAFQAISGAGMELTYAQPAIEYAREGYGVTEIIANGWAGNEAKLNQRPSGGEMLQDGRAPKRGEIMKFPEWGNTLEQIAEDRGLLEQLTTDARRRLMRAAGRVSAPELPARKRLLRKFRQRARAERAPRKADDERKLAETGSSAGVSARHSQTRR